MSRIERWLRPGARLLEVGAGSGYQASLLQRRGCIVTAVDVTVPDGGAKFWRVETFDGKRLPFPDASFDIVFSSNVLEHVVDRAVLLGELIRVLAVGGVAIHIVPSATWRLWTSVARIAYLLSSRGSDASPEGPRAASLRARTLVDVALGRPHGEFKNSLVELSEYRRAAWSRELSMSGFKLLTCFGNGLMYTGYTLFPALPIRAREAAARAFGSSCHVFVLQRIAV